jgi:hypothetical protein
MPLCVGRADYPSGTQLLARALELEFTSKPANKGLGCFVVGLLLLPSVSAGDMVIDTDETGGKAIAALFKYVS